MTAIATFPISERNSYYPTQELPAYLPQFGNMDLITAPVSIRDYSSIFAKIVSFYDLKDNWDGYGASTPSFATIKNTLAFLRSLPYEVTILLDAEDIICSSYGTIVFDFNNGGKLLSVEIGDRALGFFMEEDGEYISVSENEPFNELFLPQELETSFQTLIN